MTSVALHVTRARRGFQSRSPLTSRRTVRVDAQFFDELDAQLGAERGPTGEPSRSDFLLIDLPPIAEAFAEDLASLPPMYLDRDD